jgi:hypothetical protein
MSKVNRYYNRMAQESLVSEKSTSIYIREVGHFAYCTEWLGTVCKVRTTLLILNEDIFLPELVS